MAQYIRGTVRDKEGKGLEGVWLCAYDRWGNRDCVTSKGGGDLGQYDFVLGPHPNVWYVVVVDAAENPISPVATVEHHQPGPNEDVCWHWVDWRRRD